MAKTREEPESQVNFRKMLKNVYSNLRGYVKLVTGQVVFIEGD